MGSTSLLPLPRNILLIQLGDIGDVVLTTPTIRAVKETCPDARVSILVRKPFGDLLAADPDIYEVIESEKFLGALPSLLRKYWAFARRLRQAHYDLVIDLRTGDRGAIFTFLTGAPVRVGCQGIRKQFWHDLLFTQVIRDLKVSPPPTHPGADQSLRVVREIGIETTDSMPRLHPSEGNIARALELLAGYGLSANARWITVNPFSRWKYKEWDAAKWARMINLIWEKYRIPSILIGSREEAGACAGIIRNHESYAFNLAGKTTLGELAALLSMTSLHLGVDSAAPHIAAALDRPTVTLHGPTDWRGWRIVDGRNRVVTSMMACIPCNRKGCDDTGISQCLEQLGVDAVMDVTKEILQTLPAT